MKFSHFLHCSGICMIFLFIPLHVHMSGVKQNCLGLTMSSCTSTAGDRADVDSAGGESSRDQGNSEERQV